MLKMPEKPYTLAVKKNITSGKAITFSGWRARRLANEMLENTISLNHQIKDEKKEVIRALSRVVARGDELVSELPSVGEAALEDYKSGKHAFWAASRAVHLKLKGADCSHRDLSEKAARQLVVDEHIPNSLARFLPRADLLLAAVLANDKAAAEKSLKLLKIGAGRIEKISALLDGLTVDSAWEIKALAEHSCTRAALHIADKQSAFYSSHSR